MLYMIAQTNKQAEKTSIIDPYDIKLRGQVFPKKLEDVRCLFYSTLPSLLNWWYMS